MVYAKRPFALPAAILTYLSRYSHRVAISNHRLVALDEHGVTFRWKDYRVKGRARHKTMALGAGEFMRRFLLHVLPSGFHRIRHGLIANAGRKGRTSRGCVSCCTCYPRLPNLKEAMSRQASSSRPSFATECGAVMIIIETFMSRQSIRAAPQSRGPA